MARQFWPEEDPIGSYVTLDYVPGEEPREVIGVVGDVLLSRFQETAAPAMYVPHSQQTDTWLGPNWGFRAMMHFMVRGTGDPLTLIPSVQQAVARVDPDRPLTDIQTIDQYLGEQMQGSVLWVSLLGTFGVIAGVLAVIGIYGVVSYAVSQRTHEIGIRVALGASGATVMTLVMRQALVVVGTGLVLGIGGSLVATRLIEGTLWGVEPTDPVTFSVVSLLLLVVALVACMVPTRRAMRVDPSEALRYD
jgi:putative ABC transport system permease protein